MWPLCQRLICLSWGLLTTISRLICYNFYRPNKLILSLSLSLMKYYQHGFRRGHSCETQLISTAEDTGRDLDKQHQIDILILDFAKAFDTVPHQRLLHKLNHYGVRGQALTWIDIWFTKRTQTVVVDETMSRPVPVKSGVPQGTVLGPLLFLLYINDIGDNLQPSTHIQLFADDCLSYCTIANISDATSLQADLDQLMAWADKWQMTFSTSKCSTLRVSTMMNTKLAEIKHHPYLGVELSNDLSWGMHINNTVVKAIRVLNFLKRNLYDCPRNIKESAYTAYVRPVVGYASDVWDPHQQCDIYNLEQVQR